MSAIQIYNSRNYPTLTGVIVDELPQPRCIGAKYLLLSEDNTVYQRNGGCGWISVDITGPFIFVDLVNNTTRYVNFPEQDSNSSSLYFTQPGPSIIVPEEQSANLLQLSSLLGQVNEGLGNIAGTCQWPLPPRLLFISATLVKLKARLENIARLGVSLDDLVLEFTALVNLLDTPAVTEEEVITRLEAALDKLSFWLDQEGNLTFNRALGLGGYASFPEESGLKSAFFGAGYVISESNLVDTIFAEAMPFAEDPPIAQNTRVTFTLYRAQRTLPNGIYSGPHATDIEVDVVIGSDGEPKSQSNTLDTPLQLNPGDIVAVIVRSTGEPRLYLASASIH